MAIAKIITEGNTQKIILPEGCHFFDCDEAEVEMIGSEIRLAPKAKTESKEYRDAPDEEIFERSDKLMKKILKHIWNLQNDR